MRRRNIVRILKENRVISCVGLAIGSRVDDSFEQLAGVTYLNMCCAGGRAVVTRHLGTDVKSFSFWHADIVDAWAFPVV